MSDERYMGMSYEQASREGARLIEYAAQSGEWFALPEKLAELRAIMRQRPSDFGSLKVIEAEPGKGKSLTAGTHQEAQMLKALLQSIGVTVCGDIPVRTRPTNH